MKKDLFDNIGKRLNEYQSPVDLDKEWNGISSRQERSRNKKILFWSFTCFLIFLSGIIYVMVPYSKSYNASKVLNQGLIPIGSNNTITSVKSYKKDDEKSINIQPRENVVIFDSEKEKIKTIINSSDVKPTTKSENSINELNLFKEKNVKSNFDHTYQRSTSIKKDIAKIRVEKRRTNFSKSSDSKPLPSIFTPLVLPNFSHKKIEIAKSVLPVSKRKIQLYFNAGLGITHQKYIAKTTDSEEYSTLRNTSENPLETYTYDLGVNIPVGKRSFVSLGGNYNISFDKINYVYDAPKAYDFEDVLIGKIIYDPSGIEQEIYGDTTIIGTQTVSNIQYNKYTSTNLNASFGHYLLSKNRFSMSVTGGLSYNISLSAKGKVISPENDQGALVELKDYKKSFGLGLIGGVDFDYKITKSLILNLRPNVSYGLFSATSQSNILKSNFNKYGISIGAKYNW